MKEKNKDNKYFKYTKSIEYKKNEKLKINKREIKRQFKKYCLFISILIFSFLILYFYLDMSNFKKIKENELKNILGRNLKILSSLGLEDQKRIVEENIKEAEERRQNININLDESSKELLNLEEELLKQNREISLIEEKEYKYYEEGKNIEKELKILEDKVDYISKKAKERLTEIYKEGKYSKWEILFKADSIGELMSNYRMLQEIAKKDAILFDSANRELETYINKKEEFEKIYNEILTMRKKLEEKKVVKQNLQILKNNKVNELSEEQKQLFAKLEELEKRRKNIEQEILNSENIFGRIDRYVGGTLAWPVPSCASTKWITARYAAGYAQGYPGFFHSGVDIAPPHAIVGSATAVAAADGRVIISRRSNMGYGNYIVIDHGGGVFTLYGHASKLLVSAGDMVEKGQDILIIGSTGNSTGPHLHFEVRIGGSAYKYHTDPLPYITTPKVPLEDIIED